MIFLDCKWKKRVLFFIYKSTRIYVIMGNEINFESRNEAVKDIRDILIFNDLIK